MKDCAKELMVNRIMTVLVNGYNTVYPDFQMFFERSRTHPKNMVKNKFFELKFCELISKEGNLENHIFSEEFNFLWIINNSSNRIEF